MPTLPQFLYRQLIQTLPTPAANYSGKTVIVTGSNVGLGKEAARFFTSLGASTVILAVRSLSKGEEAKRDIEQTTKTSNVVQVYQLDMASYASVLAFADKVSAEHRRIDIAVLNAGIARTHWEEFEGEESTVTVNVTSTFLLALSLLPKLVDTAKQFAIRPNLTIVASEVHFWASFAERTAPEGDIFKTLSDKTRFETEFAADRYMTSKLLEVLAIRAIAERKSASQIPVTINCVNPGLCQSELSRDSGIMLAATKLLLARSTPYGSRTLVHAGSAGPESHGQYLSECQIQLPSAYVLSADGWRDQNRVWKELEAKLEAIRPGVTKVLA